MKKIFLVFFILNIGFFSSVVYSDNGLNEDVRSRIAELRERLRAQESNVTDKVSEVLSAINYRASLV